MTRPNLSTTTRLPATRVRGCLLGGAVGDALGAPVEFMSIQEIRARYGPQGIADFDTAYGKVGAITDDTQMTLFTAEGLLRASTRWSQRGICHVPSVIFNAYRRWLHTQSLTEPGFDTALLDGWLVTIPELHARRAPGRTCVTALQSGKAGTTTDPINGSKGCGGVMRAAPAGLVGGNAFSLGCESAALTHGHPSGWLAAGALADIVEQVVRGASLEDAIAYAMRLLRDAPEGHECVRAVGRAVDLVSAGPPSPDIVHQLGGGWTAEDALAIAVYCALAAGDDFEAGVRLAVNHDGDSDSTGAITGNILGARLGIDAIPRRWLERLELRAAIEQVADDLVAITSDDDDMAARYPGW